jgi:hypothetical protein
VQQDVRKGAKSEEDVDYDQDDEEEERRSSEEMSDDEFLKQIEGKTKRKKGEAAVDLDSMTKRQRMAYLQKQTKQATAQGGLQSAIKPAVQTSAVLIGNRKNNLAGA